MINGIIDKCVCMYFLHLLSPIWNSIYYISRSYASYCAINIHRYPQKENQCPIKRHLVVAGFLLVWMQCDAVWCPHSNVMNWSLVKTTCSSGIRLMHIYIIQSPQDIYPAHFHKLFDIYKYGISKQCSFNSIKKSQDFFFENILEVLKCSWVSASWSLIHV